MIELPEAVVLSKQLNQTIKGKRIKRVVTKSSPHKFAWFSEEIEDYNEYLAGKTIGEIIPQGGCVQVQIEGMALQFFDGVNLRLVENSGKQPEKHQILIEFEDNTILTGSVAMYGGIYCFTNSVVPQVGITPLTPEFDYDYYLSLFDERALKMSAKAFLATKQRIPGLGNGVLQDILLNAKIHPKKKMNTLTKDQIKELFISIKTTLAEMANNGGRDTEKDIYGNAGSYITKLSKNTKLSICRNCGGAVKKEAYMGGSIYYCDNCQQK